jgi:predicted nucleic acid-binding protein
MRLILDTNIYFDYAEGRPEAVDIIASKSREICLPSIVLVNFIMVLEKVPEKN